MVETEKIKPNKVNAPILFIGLGGIGSKIVKGVADRCLNDNTENIRFVVMDTDVNDLISVNSGAKITAVQTSSTCTVEDYLKNDNDAKNGWFPENRMLDPKSVSEGAGQVRAISRLALNSVIKQGVIHKLYKTIDELFLKDGGEFKQAVKVVIASSASGGTGSGIAMEVGMLVRHYINVNYPEEAVMIRGLLIMPGVMDTVIKTQSEKDSQRCNGYATIKEINAFMMKGSGFFDTVPELQRYKDLHITIPSTTGGYEKLSNLPFDFCFLLDKTDSNAANMKTRDQYIEYAAQSAYEQNIGPMQQKTSSMEDNILKLCISPEKLGRCRFGAVGASVLKYPYEDIKDYIALNWMRSAIIGSSDNDRLSDDERKKLLENSWLQFDIKFAEAKKKFEDNPNSNINDEPKLDEFYISTFNAQKEDSSGNDFVAMLWKRYIEPKANEVPETSSPNQNYDDDANFENETDRLELTLTDNSPTARITENYINCLVKEVATHRLFSEFPDMADSVAIGSKPVEKKGYLSKFRQIQLLEGISFSERIPEIARSFAKEVFSSKSPIQKQGLGEYMLEKYLSINGKAVHPNAARYLLYALSRKLDEAITVAKRNSNEDVCKETLNCICYGDKTDKEKTDKSAFRVKWNFTREENLAQMCKACDTAGSEENHDACSDFLSDYFNTVQAYYKNVIKYQICHEAINAVNNIIKSYENFYNSFTSKVPGIESKKEDIITKLKFDRGDCVKYVLSQKKDLDKLTEKVGKPIDTGKESAELYANIFNAIRNNAYIEEKKSVNPFNYEVKADIFNDIIFDFYKSRVKDTCEIINVKGILQAIKLEYNIKGLIEIEETSDDKKEQKSAEIYLEDNLKKYIFNKIKTNENLASPGIKKKDNEEEREVNCVACSINTEDGDGIKVSEFLSEAIKSDTISKYELRFFRSVYNIMPTQLAKLSAPDYDDMSDEFSITGENEYDRQTAGDYFRIYQKYMDKIGPDCKKSAIITPHIDMRWNSIVTMPELDLSYQKRLMRKIHKALLYGFVYDRIHLFATTDNGFNEIVYKYFDDESYSFDLVVSNKTKCDKLYEVLDALYNDRCAVSTISDYIIKIREKSKAAGYQSYKDIEFFRELDKFKFKNFSNEPALKAPDEKVSLFTLVLMYCNSLPAQCKDTAEMKVMLDSIINMIHCEMSLCTSSKESHWAKVAEVLIEQYNLLICNYNAHINILKCGDFSVHIMGDIKRTLVHLLKNKELDDYLEKMTAFEAD